MKIILSLMFTSLVFLQDPLQELLDSFNSERFYEPQSNIQALKSLSKSDRNIHTKLIKLCDHADPAVQYKAAKAMAYLGRNSKADIKKHIDLLKRDNRKLQDFAQYCLTLAYHAAIPDLIKAADDPKCVHHACEALAAMKSPKTQRVLKSMLDDPQKSAFAFKAMANHKVLDIKSIVWGLKSPEFRLLSLTALSTLKKDKDPTKQRKILNNHLKKNLDPKTVTAALYAFDNASVDLESFKNELHLLFKSKETHDRLQVIKLIRTNEESGDWAAELLLEGLEDGAPKVRAQAAWTLGLLHKDFIPWHFNPDKDGPPGIFGGRLKYRRSLRNKDVKKWVYALYLSRKTAPKYAQSSEAPAGLVKAYDKLIPLLEDSDKKVRRAALWALGHMPARVDEAALYLSSMLKEKDDPIRIDTLKFLNWAGPDGTKMLPEVSVLLDDPDEDIRLEAVRTVILIQPSVELQISKGFEFLSHIDDRVKRSALDTLFRLGIPPEERMPDLARVFEEGFLHAGGALTLYGKPAKNFFEKALMNKNREVQGMALVCLGALGPLASDSVDRIKTFETNPDEALNIAARHALKDIQGR